MHTNSLYQEVILDHNRKPRNYGKLDHANHHAVGHNPLCGDRLDISLQLDNDQINNIAFQGESCAICKASASMMTTAVKGKSRADAETLIHEFRELATGKLDINQPNHLGRLTVFSGIRDLPTRVKCAILPWHTLHAALNSLASASTEADDSVQSTPNHS
ncbi:Fe-S cluster assembly sulfur transfer protein SufU [Nitrosomonas sp.]|uniref:Fe-S cluster assembly sulfur transfer protein SufU n=1 Tax=Nitrosomonas sp. TaxID=42353 RepID=UPI0025F09974|nr:SUF system NifU family Fe-S cluster assembly protein [Nitrosomonas sp.]MBV6448294.1 Iron-sulfur cluster assembly scaffold protein IscU [Nitrosomonas sp.]